MRGEGPACTHNPVVSSFYFGSSFFFQRFFAKTSFGIIIGTPYLFFKTSPLTLCTLMTYVPSNLPLSFPPSGRRLGEEKSVYLWYQTCTITLYHRYTIVIRYYICVYKICLAINVGVQGCNDVAQGYSPLFHQNTKETTLLRIPSSLYSKIASGKS